MTLGPELKRLHSELHWKPLSKRWARFEILLGLAAFVGGLSIVVVPGMIPSGNSGTFVPGGAALATLGGYLALAGHRSHLYQSNVKLAAYMIHCCAGRFDSQSPQSQKSHAPNRPNLPGSHDN